MAFVLENLKYGYDALEEVIDKETMEIHHSKHHHAYVNNLNAALEGTEFADKSLEYLLTHLNELPAEKVNAVRNNGGGHYNHGLFWETMTPGGAKEPVGNLKEAIEKKFGSFENFKAEFEAAGAGRFGSGWVNLVKKDGEISIVSNPNQDSPITDGYTVIIGNDVWEHAYYLRYQNRRPEYLKNWWKVVNWDIAEERYNR